MPKLFSRVTTIKNLKHFQKWRLGEIDEFSKRYRVPPPKYVTKLLDSVMYYLEHNELEVWTPPESLVKKSTKENHEILTGK